MIKIKIEKKVKIIIVLSIILLIFSLSVYELDKIILPTIMITSEMKAKEHIILILNNSFLESYNNNFGYDDFIRIEKDNYGNIVLIKANTMKLNKFACEYSLSSQKKLMKLNGLDIKVPLGYIFKNNIISNLGPEILVKAEPIGNVETKYISKFESAGINQTRHIIYLQVKTNLKIIVATKFSEVSACTTIPIAETIIVGKIPSGILDMKLNNAGFKLPAQ